MLGYEMDWRTISVILVNPKVNLIPTELKKKIEYFKLMIVELDLNHFCFKIQKHSGSWTLH